MSAKPMAFTATELACLPLTPCSYNVLHGVSLNDCTSDAFKAYYAWFERYGRKLRPIMKYWFIETEKQWDARLEEMEVQE